MDLILTIGTGAGLAAACGIRPFLPLLLAGALASSDTGIDFDHTDWSFLESPLFLLGVLLALAATVALQRRNQARRNPDVGRDGETRFDALLAGLSFGFGGALMAGALAGDDHSAWIGLAGIACAMLGRAAVGELLERAGSRLDPRARAALPVYADGVALVLAALAVLFGPLSYLALALLAFILVRGRQRAGEKYAGLRILR
jgi:hypothetical protein